MHVAVTAIGVDRPGIVAAVTRTLYEQGCNLEDSRMAILGGHFAMMLIVALPPSGEAAALEEALTGPARNHGLVVAVRPVREAPPGEAEGVPYVLSVYGADRPGIVYRVAAALAERDVNITDLATHVLEGDPPVYVMILEATLPPGLDAGQLEADLRRLAEEMSVDLSLRPGEADTL